MGRGLMHDLIFTLFLVFLVYYLLTLSLGVVSLYFTGALAWFKVFWILGSCLNINA